MYKHLVMWRLKDDAPDKQALAREIITRRLDSLSAVIKEIRQYEVGINTGAYDASFFDVGLISAFDDKAGFARYAVRIAFSQFEIHTSGVRSQPQGLQPYPKRNRLELPLSRFSFCRWLTGCVSPGHPGRVERAPMTSSERESQEGSDKGSDGARNARELA